jgi:hypothetical protein
VKRDEAYESKLDLIYHSFHTYLLRRTTYI